jgi:outer membrane biosynthesis protein TonB
MVASATAAYVWEDPGDSIMVQISLEVVGRLGEAVQQSLGTGPRGAEIGGLLLGHSLSGGGRSVQIDDFELVACQHLRGASYTLAPKDRETLGAQLARRRTGQVVGYFRSHTRPGLYLDQDDFAILSRYFSDPAQVCLVVRPSADGPAVGGFFFWEEGDINRRAPYREFPFDREQLVGGGFSIADRLAVAPAAPHSPPPIARPATIPRFRLPHVPWVAVPIIGGLFLLAGLFVSQKDTPKSIPAPVQPVAQRQPVVQRQPVLTLEAEKAGQVLQLRWDPNVPAVRKADLGVLWITDGAQRQRRELSRQELAAGSTSYTPSSTNVDFELQVFTLTDRTNKSIQWAAPEAPPAPTEVAQAVPAQQPVQPAPAAPRALAPPTSAAMPVDPTAAKPHAKRPPPKHLNPLVPPPVETAKAASPIDVPPPPSLAAPAERSQQKLVAVLPPRVVSLPPAPEAVVSLEPVHGSALKRALHKISTLGEGETEDGFVPPAPVHKVSPAIPSGPLQADGSVDVKVYIDESGNVSRAQLLTKKSELAGASLGAARQWHFRPARKHDKPVASEVVLHFRFGGA